MYTLRRWWDKNRIQIILASLALGGALFLRQTQGATLFELYQLLSRPFQATPNQVNLLTNARIREMQQRLDELNSQNQQLRNTLGYATETAQPQQVIVPVIGRSAEHWWQQILLGRGSGEGIREGYVVMAPGGLVGRVVNVTPNTSRVLLISDPENKVGVTISRSRAMGYISGQASNRAVMEFFDKVPDVRPGDLVSTSTFSQFYPPGLPVGRVESVNSNKSPAPEAIIELSAPISYLEWAIVRPPVSPVPVPPPASEEKPR